MNRSPWIRSIVLVGLVLGAGVALAAWKVSAIRSAQAAAASQPEPMEAVSVATAAVREHRATTTAIGTVLALRSITLRNEEAGTVSRVRLEPGEIVDAGTVLVALDVSVEEAELKAQEAQAELAQTLYMRTQKMSEQRAASANELDSARAERDIAAAQVARTRAVIARKTIRAPFRARVGIADVHPGQFLEEGSLLTTLQGVDAGVHVDFTVAQQVAAALRVGDAVQVASGDAGQPLAGKIVAIDARVDPATRNAMVRARIDDRRAPSPGASARVTVPLGAPRQAVAIPASALRKGPTGDHVFVIVNDAKGQPRAQVRPVGVAAMLADEVVIDTGVKAGEQVATSGSFKLREGALVAVTPQEAPSPPRAQASVPAHES